MSAPRRAMRDAQEISYGFLAAKTSSALSKVKERHPLSQDDIAVLGKATTFLKEIADGVLITSKGEIAEGVRPSSSIAALDFALGPIASLKEIIKAEHSELEPMFRRLWAAVSAAHENRVIPNFANSISEAQLFFDDLSAWLANEFTARKRSNNRVRDRGH